MPSNSSYYIHNMANSAERNRTESNGILGQRAAGLGGGRSGGGSRRGALMGLGRLLSPAGGPQEALACGLALGRPAIAAVRWADRLREKRPSPCGLPSLPQPPPLFLPLHRCSGFGEQQAAHKQTKTGI